MDVELLYVEGCPNVELARARLTEAADRAGVQANISEHLVTDEVEAVETGMRGSPTIRIGGRDLAAADTPGSISCRVFVTDAGVEGAPSVEDLITALTAAPEK